MWMQIELSRWTTFSMSRGKCGTKFKSRIFNLIIQNNNLGTRSDIALRWMPQILTDEM